MSLPQLLERLRSRSRRTRGMALGLSFAAAPRNTYRRIALRQQWASQGRPGCTIRRGPPIARARRALSGQAYRGEAGRPAVAAAASSSCRALGGGARHRAGDDRRQGADARERIGLRAERRPASSGKSRQDRSRAYRGAKRQLSRRRTISSGSRTTITAG